MKYKLKNGLATTGLSLLLLAVVATLYQGRFLCIETVFQVLAANLVIHFGLAILERFESPYYLVEILAEMGFILFILIIAGFLFKWYQSIPLWVLLAMGIAVYVIGSIIDIFCIQSDVDFINEQLRIRNEPKRN